MAKFEDGTYFACPQCKKVTAVGWKETWSGTFVFHVRPDPKEGMSSDQVKYELAEPPTSPALDSRHISTRHECGFMDAFWPACDFLIKIENDTIVDAGAYWHYHPDELGAIAKRNGLKVDVYQVVGLISDEDTGLNMPAEDIKKLLAVIMGCSVSDLSVLLNLPPHILIRAIENVKNNGLEVNFTNVLTEAVWTACDMHRIYRLEIGDIEPNYSASKVYVRSRRAYTLLKQLGFPVVMSDSWDEGDEAKIAVEMAQLSDGDRKDVKELLEDEDGDI